MNIKTGSIYIDEKNRHIKVESESSPGNYHYVLVNAETGQVEKCSCKAYANIPGPCKHMKAVISQRFLQEERT